MKIIAKKYMGQNFLADQRVIDRIVDACALSEDETILEIGPGQGALTQGLLPHVKRLVAVEADRILAESLQQEYAGRNLEVHYADFLKFNLHQLPHPLKIVGNIPYHISTPILTRVIHDRRLISSVFMTIQYELGERLVAGAGAKDYSALSCIIQMFAKPEILFKIPPQAFRPVPKVMSCLLKVVMRQTPAEQLEDESVFLKIVRLAFGQRRKNLLNALAPLYPSAKDHVAVLLKEAGVNAQWRAENLSNNHYARIANAYAKTFRHNTNADGRKVSL